MQSTLRAVLGATEIEQLKQIEPTMGDEMLAFGLLN
jgi:hypothetical protein